MNRLIRFFSVLCCMAFLPLYSTVPVSDDIYDVTQVASAGGSVSTQVGSLSCTVGQAILMSQSTTAGSITLGVQQGYTIGETVYLNTPQYTIEVNVFPNPTVDIINVQVNAALGVNSCVKLHNEQGVLLEQATIEGLTHAFDVSAYQSGTYLMSVVADGQLITTNTIIIK